MSMRKRTFEDRKFSQGDSNSDAFRDNWDRMFGSARYTSRAEDGEPLELDSAEPSATQLPTPTPNQE